MIPNKSRRAAEQRARTRRLFAARAAQRDFSQHEKLRIPPAAYPAPWYQRLGFASASTAIGLPEQEFEALLARLKSTRDVRPVITPSGHRARGRFPSLKTYAAPNLGADSRAARYESLVERDTWRVLEVASDVEALATHPTVLMLPGAGAEGAKHYTPDAKVVWKARALCMEVKGMHWIQKRSSRDALRATLRRMRVVGVPLALISEADVREDGLQPELAELLRLRPSAGLHRQGVDAAAWDPLHRTEPDAATLRRWMKAQAVCNALLERVMRRDPDEFIQSIPIKH